MDENPGFAEPKARSDAAGIGSKTRSEAEPIPPSPPAGRSRLKTKV
jgi:hypothetical protein